jgi:putative membrane protein insertion efficiency factor
MVGNQLNIISDKETSRRHKKIDPKAKSEINLKRAVDGTGWLVSHLVIVAIRIYQNTFRFLFAPSCRFHPSCSEYAAEAFKRFGPVKGVWLTLRRLSRCHPFNPGGFDPLP